MACRLDEAGSVDVGLIAFNFLCNSFETYIKPLSTTKYESNDTMRQGILDKSSKKGKKKSSKKTSIPTPSSTSPGSSSQHNRSSSSSLPNTSTPNFQKPLGEQLHETLRRTRNGTHNSRGQACTALGALASQIVDVAQYQSILENLDLDICNEIFLPMRQAPIRHALNGRSDPESITDDIFFSSMSIGFITTLFNQFFQQGGSLDNKTTFTNMMDVLFKMVAKGGVVKRLSPWGENYANLPRAHVVGFGDAKCTAEALFLLNKMLGDDDSVGEISKERSLLLKKVAREGHLIDLAEGIQRLTATVRGGKLKFMEEEEEESYLEFNALEKAVQLGNCLVFDLEKVLGQTIDVEYPKQAMKMIDAASDAFGLIADVQRIGQMMIVRRGSPIPIMHAAGSFDTVMRLCVDIQWHVQPLLLQLFNSEFSPEMAAMLRKRTKWTKYLRNGAGMMFRSKALPIYKRRSLCLVLKMMFDLHKERGLLGDPGVNGAPPTGMVFFKILVEITRIEIGICLKDALAPPGTIVESAEHESKKMTALERAYECSGVYFTILDNCIDALAVCATHDNGDDGANKDAECTLPLNVALRAMATIHDSIVAMLDFIEAALFDPAFTTSQPAPTSSSSSNRSSTSSTSGIAPSWMADTFKRSLILTGAVKVVGHYSFENPEPLAHRIVPLLPLLLSMKCAEEWRTELNCSLLHRETAMRTGWTELPEGVQYFQDTLYGIAGAVEPHCWDEYTRAIHEDEEEEGSGKKNGRRRRRKAGNDNDDDDDDNDDDDEEDLPEFLEIECSEEVRDVWMKGMLTPAAFSCVIDSLETLGRASRGKDLFRSMAALVYRLVSYPGFDIVTGDAAAEEKEKEGVSCSTDTSLSPQLLLALKAVKPLLEYTTKYKMAEMAEATIDYLVHNNMEAIDRISNGVYYLRFGFVASLILKKSFLQLDDDGAASHEEDEQAKTAVIYRQTGVTLEFIAEKLLLLMEAFCEKLLSLFYIRCTRGSFSPAEVQVASAVRVDVARCAEHCLEIAKRDRRFLGACAENSWLIEDVARFRGAHRQTKEKGYPDELVEFALFCEKEGSHG